MSRRPNASERVQLQFDDNSLLPLLFGEHDRNLARIEQELGVSLVSRGNKLAISGPEGSVAAATGRGRGLTGPPSSGPG